MIGVEVIQPRWSGLVIVAAPGPALTKEVAEQCRGQTVLAVSTAWQRLPWAEVLYACDGKWWDAHNGAPGFAGERWSSHHKVSSPKIEAAQRHKLRLVAADFGKGFSFDPAKIYYGRNSGFQGINLALLMGGNPIVLVGFDMRGTEHFCERPKRLRSPRDYSALVSEFEQAARMLPPGIRILNATKGSAIGPKIFPHVKLDEVLCAPSA